MSPSSLIFLLIVAIWAAYLLQHWVRRRENLATARTVDRFSEAMRILERRERYAATLVDTREHRSYAGSPVRAARPSVVVKQARPEEESSDRPESDRPRRRRGRGILLLVAVLALVALAVLVPVLALPWWAPAAAGGVVLVDLAWLRASARRRSADRKPARRKSARRTSARGAARSADLGSSPSTSGLPDEPRETARRAARGSRVRRPVPEAVVYDEVAAEAQPTDTPAATASRVNAAPPAVDPNGWQPVPVPPPTYTLKAKAERPAQAPAATSGADDVPDGVVAEPWPDQAAAAGTGELDYSRVPTSELPFDGYALDEELEELPAVYRAGA